MKLHHALVALTLLVGGCSNVPPPPGKLYDVGGFRLHLACTGPADTGQPTVIIENGGGVTSAGYYWLQHGLESQVRVCSYDRAGMGWSDRSDTPRDAATITNELHRLLQAAGVRPPYVLAGHSIGGLYIPVFTQAWPDEVAGLVFLDPSHPRQYQLVPGVTHDKVDKALLLTKAIGWYARLGLLHVWNPLGGAPPAGMELPPAEAVATVQRLSKQSKQYFAMGAELAAFDQSGAQAAAVTSLGDRPVAVLSATAADGKPSPEQAAEVALARPVILDLHRQIAALSTRGRQVLVEGAGHMSLVVDRRHAERAVAEILQVVRDSAAPR